MVHHGVLGAVLEAGQGEDMKEQRTASQMSREARHCGWRTAHEAEGDLAVSRSVDEA